MKQILSLMLFRHSFQVNHAGGGNGPAKLFGLLPKPQKVEWLSGQGLRAYILESLFLKSVALKPIAGQGGMDFLMDWRIIDCLRNGLPVDMDVYDAALWSAIAPLSEKSVANRYNSVTIPDFTAGAWKTNKPVDILLENGGSTKVLL